MVGLHLRGELRGASSCMKGHERSSMRDSLNGRHSVLRDFMAKGGGH